MTLTQDHLQKILDTARKATQMPYRYDGKFTITISNDDLSSVTAFRTNKADVEHIAACSPEVVEEIVEELIASRERALIAIEYLEDVDSRYDHQEIVNHVKRVLEQ